jgi:hypothetical protein
MVNTIPFPQIANLIQQQIDISGNRYTPIYQRVAIFFFHSAE